MRFVRKIRFNREEVMKILVGLDDYVWVVVDVRRGMIAAGDELMSQLRRELLLDGSNIRDVYGVGLDLVTGELDYYSQINVKQVVPESTKEVPMEQRERIETLVKYFFEELPVFRRDERGRYVRYEGIIR